MDDQEAVRCFVAVVLQHYLTNISAQTVDRVRFMSLHCSKFRKKVSHLVFKNERI